MAPHGVTPPPDEAGDNEPSDPIEDLEWQLAAKEADRLDARLAMREGADENERLRAALEVEWRRNHDDQCDGDCESLGGEAECAYPRPPALY